MDEWMDGRTDEQMNEICEVYGRTDGRTKELMKSAKFIKITSIIKTVWKRREKYKKVFKKIKISN